MTIPPSTSPLPSSHKTRTSSIRPPTRPHRHNVLESSPITGTESIGPYQQRSRPNISRVMGKGDERGFLCNAGLCRIFLCAVLFITVAECGNV